MPTPLVSICCLTYNHAPFIRNCIDGFIAQQTDFPIEILVHDDASTDGTDGIVREYADKYPEIIFPLFEEENQYSRGYAGKMDIEFNYSRARGKYIAYLITAQGKCIMMNVGMSYVRDKRGLILRLKCFLKVG